MLLLQFRVFVQSRCTSTTARSPRDTLAFHHLAALRIHEGKKTYDVVDNKHASDLQSNHPNLKKKKKKNKQKGNIQYVNIAAAEALVQQEPGHKVVSFRTGLFKLCSETPPVP